jgi:hypothetical protein
VAGRLYFADRARLLDCILGEPSLQKDFPASALAWITDVSASCPATRRLLQVQGVPNVQLPMRWWQTSELVLCRLMRFCGLEDFEVNGCDAHACMHACLYAQLKMQLYMRNSASL